MANSVDGMDTAALGNRRAHRRAALSASVLIDSARSHHTGRCRDVSEGGLLVELETELPLGMPVDLYFELPTGIAIEARAEVARSASGALGLRFEMLGDADRSALVAYCESWRRALLNSCASRVASIPNLRLTSSALSAPSASPAFEADEQNSGVRIRVADEWQSTGPKPKPKPA